MMTTDQIDWLLDEWLAAEHSARSFKCRMGNPTDGESRRMLFEVATERRKEIAKLFTDLAGDASRPLQPTWDWSGLGAATASPSPVNSGVVSTGKIG